MERTNAPNFLRCFGHVPCLKLALNHSLGGKVFSESMSSSQTLSEALCKQMDN